MVRKICAVFLFVVTCQLAVFGQKPDPTKVYIESITYGGTGCPQGTVSKTISEDRTVFTLIFDAYVASYGPSVPVTENRKSCQLNVNLKVPMGWSYSVGTVDYRGYAQLPSGSKANLTAPVSLISQGKATVFSKSITGPVNGDSDLRLDVAADTIQWSSCTTPAPLTINTDIAIVSDGAGTGKLTNSTTDGKVKFSFGLAWRPCK